MAESLFGEYEWLTKMAEKAWTGVPASVFWTMSESDTDFDESVRYVAQVQAGLEEQRTSPIDDYMGNDDAGNDDVVNFELNYDPDTDPYFDPDYDEEELLMGLFASAPDEVTAILDGAADDDMFMYDPGTEPDILSTIVDKPTTMPGGVEPPSVIATPQPTQVQTDTGNNFVGNLVGNLVDYVFPSSPVHAAGNSTGDGSGDKNVLERTFANQDYQDIWNALSPLIGETTGVIVTQIMGGIADTNLTWDDVAWWLDQAPGISKEATQQLVKELLAAQQSQTDAPTKTDGATKTPLNIDNILAEVVKHQRRNWPSGGLGPAGTDQAGAMEAFTDNYRNQLLQLIKDNPDWDMTALTEHLTEAGWLPGGKAATGTGTTGTTGTGATTGETQTRIKKHAEDDEDRGNIITNEDLRTVYYPLIYNDPYVEYASEAKLEETFYTSQTLFLLEKGMDAWRQIEGEDKDDAALRGQYEQYLKNDFLKRPFAERLGSDYYDLVGEVNRIFTKAPGPNVEDWSDEDQAKNIWVQGLYGGDSDWNQGQRDYLVTLGLTRGASGQWSNKIRIAAKNQMKYYRNIGWSEQKIFNHMTNIAQGMKKAVPPSDVFTPRDQSLMEGREPFQEFWD